MRKRIAAVALIAAFAVTTSRSGVKAQAPPVPPGAEFVQGELLIKFRSAATDDDKREARDWFSAERLEVLTADGGGELELVRLPPGVSEEVAASVLSQHPLVTYAEPNWLVTHQATSNDPYYLDGSLWGMYGDATTPANTFGSQAGEAWAAGFTGSSNVVVGVIDEGIDLNHPDLAANIWTNPFEIPGNSIDDDGNGYVDDIHGWDFYQNNNTIFDGGPGSTVDAHGTHVSGTIGALSNTQGVVGVNWNVTIISAKFLGPVNGSTADAVKAVNYLTDLKQRHNLNIVATNNSWGGGAYSQSLHDAIIRAAKADILFVAAAGNNGVNTDSTPQYPAAYNTSVGTGTESAASYDSVISVASITSSGAKSSFSNYGAATVDLGAPGSGIWSTTPTNGYSSYSGTSMATPHVTGAAALYRSTHPSTSAANIKAAILSSAQNTPTASLAGITVTGGRLNVGSLMGAATAPPAPTSLVATAGVGQVGLSWTGATGATSYDIYRALASGGPYTSPLASTTGTSYTDTNVTNGTTYYYVVRAVNGAGSSGNSNEANATPTSGGGGGGGLITLAASSGLQQSGANVKTLSYSVTVGGGLSNGLLLVTVGSYAPSSISVSSVTYGGQPLTRIRRDNNGVNGAYIELWSRLAPAAGTGNVVVTMSNTVEQISSEALVFSGVDQTTPVEAQTGSVLTGTHGAHSNTLMTVTNNAWVVDAMAAPGPLTPGAGQTVRGSGALHGVSTRGPVSPAGATTMSWSWPVNGSATAQSLIALRPAATTGTIPPAPTSLVATAGVGQVGLSWTGATGATSYDIYRALASGGPYTSPLASTTGTSYTDTNVTNGTTYYYVVRAVNGAGSSGNSNEANATPTSGGGGGGGLITLAASSGLQQSGANVKTLSYSVTVGGGLSNGLLLVTVGSYAPSSISVSSVTYGGQPLTRIRRDNNGVNGAYIELWSRLAPAAGTGNVVVTMSNTVEQISSGAMVFTGVDQTNPVEAQTGSVVAGATHGSHSNTLTTVTNNAWVVDAMAAPGPVTAGAGQTMRWGGGMHGASTRGPVSPAGPTTMSWSWPASGSASAQSLIALRPAP